LSVAKAIVTLLPPNYPAGQSHVGCSSEFMSWIVAGLRKA
jgi:hypothetical protein